MVGSVMSGGLEVKFVQKLAFMQSAISFGKAEEQFGVLSDKLGGGPHGFGDPNDRTLRKVETDVLIPKIMREKARTEKCIPEVDAFKKCCKENGLMMVVKCRKETAVQRQCFEKWYQDEGFKKECTDVYLQERSEYRANGKKGKEKKKESTMF
ncbi:hypothetical protein QYM36_009485 [Artemia franciscana]|uniref:COX assembly mitochondrial protein n=1 Tax=Artemia franciscana TaxID=6661 RepID=A0AA88L5G5_ARTSF|nr:hypothetical protein QYM36_009485 [Artemia franciscana]